MLVVAWSGASPGCSRGYWDDGPHCRLSSYPIFGRHDHWSARWLDYEADRSFFENRIRAAFKMIVNNFSIGIIGFVYLIINYQFIGPIIEVANNLVKAIEGLVHTGMLHS